MTHPVQSRSFSIPQLGQFLQLSLPKKIGMVAVPIILVMGVVIYYLNRSPSLKEKKVSSVQRREEILNRFESFDQDGIVPLQSLEAFTAVTTLVNDPKKFLNGVFNGLSEKDAIFKEAEALKLHDFCEGEAAPKDAVISSLLHLYLLIGEQKGLLIRGIQTEGIEGVTLAESQCMMGLIYVICRLILEECSAKKMKGRDLLKDDFYGSKILIHFAWSYHACRNNLETYFEGPWAHQWKYTNKKEKVDVDKFYDEKHPENDKRFLFNDIMRRLGEFAGWWNPHLEGFKNDDSKNKYQSPLGTNQQLKEKQVNELIQDKHLLPKNKEELAKFMEKKLLEDKKSS